MAVSMGAIVSALATGAGGEISTAPMAQLPLVLVPAFLVPFFVMLHLSALFQARWPRYLGIQARRLHHLLQPIVCMHEVSHDIRKLNLLTSVSC